MQTKTMFLAAACALGLTGTQALADCGEVSMTEMNWASSQVITHVSKFLMEQGYGCTVQLVPSATIPAVASMAENAEPDIVSELWLNSAGEAYTKLVDEGSVETLADVLDPGGVEGWWIPDYLAEAHPELNTVQDIMANPELVGGRFNNCPVGWGCRIVNDNVIIALGMRDVMEIFDHGSGETLGASIASAYEAQEPWFGYYWAPTAVLGKYPMKQIKIGDIDEAVHLANQDVDNPNPGVSDFPPAPVLTASTAGFIASNPEIADLMRNVSFPVGIMNSVLAWRDNNNASAEEAAVYFLTNHSDVWSDWVNAAARDKLSALIK